MRRNTTKALVNLAAFLKPQRTDLLDQEIENDEQVRLLARDIRRLPSIIGAMADAGFATESTGLADLEEILSEPLSIILDQILAPQGLNQIIFAFDFITQYLQPGSICARYAETRGRLDLSTLQAANRIRDYGNLPEEERITDFNGMLQGPAGGFAIYNHEAVYKMYPASDGPSTGLRTEKIQEADYQNPTKGNPTFGYIAILDPRYNYSRTESEIASTMTRAIPTAEFSKCVPYFNLSISSAASTPNEDGVVSNNMSYNKFFEGGLSGVDVNTMSGLQSSVIMGEDPTNAADAGGQMPTSGSMNTSIGMEAFTMPQSIVPMGQANNAWQGDESGRYNSFASIDRARPFMSVDSFNVTESPTRGASSTQRAKMTITIHDRARLREVGDLLKPATLNKVEFTVEYGWSHPQGNELFGNVYGQLINSMRSKGTFSLSNSSYSFTDDGQVKVTLDMVCKGAESINVIDCALTGQLAVLSDVVEKSYEALAVARDSSVSELGLSWVTELTATQHINTMTLNSVGSMVSGETANAIDDWIRRTGRSSSPAHLREFSGLLDTLRDAAQNMSNALIEDLTAKVSVLENKSYNDWSIFTHATLLQTEADAAFNPEESVVPLYNGAGNKSMERNWDTGKNSYAPLGALLQLFIVHPLHNSGQYDEVQLVTYTANLNASISAGANLGAIPIDIKKIGDRSDSTLLKVLTNEYKINGGQYPINRFIRFVNETYIQPHMSSCYGFGTSRGGNTGSSALNYNKKTGAVTSDAIDGASQAKISKALREYYYGETYEGDPFDPRPTTFTPIDLKIVFDVSKGDSNDITATTGVRSTTQFGEKTVLRIHVFDQASGDRPGAMNVLRENIKKGMIIPGFPKAPAGMSHELRSILLPDGFDFNDTRKICAQLEENGILKSESWDNVPAPNSAGNLQSETLERRQTALRAKLALNSLSNRERRRFEEQLEVVDARLGQAAPLSKFAKAFSLDAAPQRLIDYCAQAAPNVVYGEEGSIVQQISIKSKTNSRQASMFMRRALEGGGSDSNVNRGVPMRMMPADMGIDMLGNPNIKYMQKFFIKLGTGTNLDNLYGVSGLSHNITPDSFKTNIKLVAHSAYGIFNSLVSNIDDVKSAIDTMEQKMAQQIRDRIRNASNTATSNAGTRLADRRSNADTALREIDLKKLDATNQRDMHVDEANAFLREFSQQWWDDLDAHLRSTNVEGSEGAAGTAGYEDIDAEGLYNDNIRAWTAQRSQHSTQYRALFLAWKPIMDDWAEEHNWNPESDFHGVLPNGNGGFPYANADWWKHHDPDIWPIHEHEVALAEIIEEWDAANAEDTEAAMATVEDTMTPAEEEAVARAKAAGLN